MFLFILSIIFVLIWTGCGALVLRQWIQDAISIQEQMKFFAKLESEQAVVSNAARYFTRRMDLYNANQDLLALLKEKEEQPKHFWYSTTPSFLLLGPILMVPFLRNRIY